MHITEVFRPIVLNKRKVFLSRIIEQMHPLSCIPVSLQQWVPALYLSPCPGPVHCLAQTVSKRLHGHAHTVHGRVHSLAYSAPERRLFLNEYSVLLTLSLKGYIELLTSTMSLNDDFVLFTLFLNE
jgi:hypothetical protein